MGIASDSSAVRLRGVSRTYAAGAGGPVEALRDVDLNVCAGEFVALIGPSGCGKSTLLRLVAGLDTPSSGVIEVGQTDDDADRCVAYMPQRDLLFPWRSLLENATIGAELAGKDKREIRQQAIELLPEFGLEGFGDAFPQTLSGGMRQRAALLRTVLLNRRTLLLDEPFGALDALTRASMQEWLLGVLNRHSVAVMFVTHDVEEAIWLSDRVYVMTSRPGTIKLEVEIRLSRPRNHAVRSEPEFAKMKSRILHALISEAL